jgi:predicted ATPase
MKLRQLTLTNFRSYDGDNEINFSPTITLLVGPNNSGKSAIIAALRLLQGEGGQFTAQRWQQMIRVGKPHAQIRYLFDQPSDALFRAFGGNPNDSVSGLQMVFAPNQQILRQHVGQNGPSGNQMPLGRVFDAQEPNNAFYWFFSGRRPYLYQGQIGKKAESTIRENYSYLPARIDKHSSLGNPTASRFQQKISEILGLQLCAAGGPNENQKIAGMYTHDAEHFIEIEDMGAGVSQVAAFVADLVGARGKIFLVEELENDLHPAALTKLLQEIVLSSQYNQFIISTHSNIVVTRLGSLPDTKIISTQLASDSAIPTTNIAEISQSATSRAALLESLGYGIVDFGLLHVGYLLLEESTAERVIRDYFIPRFTPRLLGRLRVFPSGGLGKVEKRFEALQSIFVFLHTSGVYSTKSWVRVDAGPQSEMVVSRLREKNRALPSSRFGMWEKTNFEEYYPQQFHEEIGRLQGITNWQEKMEAKGKLANDVVVWALAHPGEAETHFTSQAQDVIACLRAIEQELDV